MTADWLTDRAIELFLPQPTAIPLFNYAIPCLKCRSISLNQRNSTATEKPYPATEPGIPAKFILALLIDGVDLAWKFR